MEVQPLDIIDLIASHLNLRSLVAFSACCSRHRKKLTPRIEKLKRRIFTPIPFAFGKLVHLPGRPVSCYFCFGPSFGERLPSNMPIDGVYFSFEPDLQKIRGVQFFFKENFGDMLNANPNERGMFVATLDTDVIHTADWGMRGFTGSIISWIDFVHDDYQKIFDLGKKTIRILWSLY